VTADDVSAAPETIDEAEVVVVGGGPAGASCAALLAERGHDVLIVDQERFPRDKPCGDGLTRSAVAFCERLGLGELMEEAHPVMGLRVVLDHRSYEYREYAPTPRRPQRARCIPRRTLDEALLQAALARGARFRHARVTGSARTNGLVRTDTLVDNRPAALRSRFVVAADGATSRLRRTAGHGRIDDDTMAYAVRAYFRCEQALEPVFEAYVPLDFDGQGIAGYGWLFPIDAHTANIGVGYWRGGGLRSPTNMRAVLDAFVEQLMLRGRRRFGEWGCVHCHIPPLTYSSHGVYDVGFADERGLRKFNPPSLRGVGQGYRFLHDNRAASLEEVFTKFGHQVGTDVDRRDLADLLRFLRSL